MSKRKWKVYTTEELKDRFQPKPGTSLLEEDAQKVVVPNLKRRNSAPPGMIHFPPGTFSSSNSNSPNSAHSPIMRSHSPQQGQGHVHGQGQGQSPNSVLNRRAEQHELITHAPRGRVSPSPLSSLSKASGSVPYPYPSRRRASLPYIPPDLPLNMPFPFQTGGGSSSAAVPAIEAYLSHLQNIPLPHQDLDMHDDESPIPSPPSNHHASSSASSTSSHIKDRGLTHSPSQPPLPSFQSLLQTIREDADEEDTEIREIEERAMQGSKSLPTFKDLPQNPHPPQPDSPSSKFYKHNVSKSNDNLPSLSRMSISDIIS